LAAILLTHPTEELRTRFSDKALAALRELGEVRVNGSERSLSTDELIARAQGCRVIFCDRLTPGEAPLFAALPELVAFCRGAVDVRNIDVAAASANGVLVTHAAPTFVDAVAELTFGLMLDLARGISQSVALYHQGREPPAEPGVQLSGSTLGVIGYGSIGRRVAALGLAFGMRVLVSDPYVDGVSAEMAHVDLPVLLGEADFVVCLAIGKPDTDGLMDAAAFARMKPTAFFINPSRGNLVDDAALEAALRSGRIAGAALDVGMAPGQMPPPDLAALPNVVATPHIGGLTREAVEAQALGTVAQVADILRGQMPPRALNAEHATRLRSAAG
jgi:D-3-phosphoglycerate dehydrogenase / 2-oxoglutarate reductase